jgi:GT2 family glycosyltransferase
VESRPWERAITPVLVAYNSADIFPWSLPALASCEHLIVVDNNSRDPTQEVVRQLVAHATVIPAGQNLGFGRANNLALAAVQTPFALLINPDAQLRAGALEALWHAAQRYPDAAILAPVIFDSQGIQGASFHAGTEVSARQTPIVPDGELCVNFVSGAVMMLNLSNMKSIGFFDPWYFLYGEDDDLCMRIRKAGGSIIVVNNAFAEHHTRESSTPSLRTTFRRAYCMTLSKFYITRKYQGSFRCFRMMMRIGIGSLLALPIHLILMRSERAIRMSGRIAATLMAWHRMNATHCFEPLN